MANPWEDYGGTAEAAGPWDEFKPKAPTVRPGDVAARKAQMDKLAAGEEPNRAREDLSVLGEFASGVAKSAGGVTDVTKALIPGTGTPLSSLLPQDLSVQGVLDTPVAKAGLGLMQAVASPMAPLTNAITRGGEAVSDSLQKRGFTTAADVAGGLTTAVSDVLAPGAIAKGAKALRPLARGSEFLKSNRAKGAEASARGEAAIASAEAKAAGIRTAADEGIAFATSSAEAARESAQSFGEAAKRNIPGKADLERVGGTELGNATGQKFQEHYHGTRTARKEGLDQAYDNVLGPKPTNISTVDKVDNTQEVGRSLQDKIRAAVDPQERAAAEKAFSEFVSTGVAPEATNLHDLHDALIATRGEARAAGRLQNDNAKRLLGIKEDGILQQMDKVQPGTTDALAAVDASYASRYAPYFSKGSLTRAIAEKDAAAVAKNAILPTSKGGKEVATITRTLELIGDNSDLRQQLGQAHLNGLIDNASKGTSFRESFVKEWDKYTNVKGNGNRVLRAAYGEDYDSVNSLVNQFKNSKPKDFDKAVSDMVTAADSRAAGTAKGLESGAKFAEKAKDAEVKLIQKQMKADVEQFTGRGAGAKLESIGIGIFTSGVVGGNQVRALRGGMVAIGAKGLGKLGSTIKGRSIWKAILRGTPGTAQAAATARIAESLINEDGGSYN